MMDGTNARLSALDAHWASGIDPINRLRHLLHWPNNGDQQPADEGEFVPNREEFERRLDDLRAAALEQHRLSLQDQLHRDEENERRASVFKKKAQHLVKSVVLPCMESMAKRLPTSATVKSQSDGTLLHGITYYAVLTVAPDERFPWTLSLRFKFACEPGTDEFVVRSKTELRPSKRVLSESNDMVFTAKLEEDFEQRFEAWIEQRLLAEFESILSLHRSL